ncbi:MAG: lysylphosphatidylglycerol synthase domain-containing protein [Microvirga sp.]
MSGRSRAVRILRFLWILLAVGFVVHFCATRWATVLQLQRSLTAGQLAGCLLLIVAGKLVYTDVVRRTLAMVGSTGGFGEAFYAYNVSQLGKYIPGSIWQFVGRYEIYRRYGVGPGQAFQIMVLENGLMLGTALLIGAGAVPALAILVTRAMAPQWLAVAGAAVLVGAVLSFLHGGLRARLLAIARTIGRHRALVAIIAGLFVAMWVLLGLSTLVLFSGYADIPAPFMIALFAVSYVVGFAAIFAPAGIGVRDVVFTVGLTGMVDPQIALLLTIGHRLVYILADVLCGATAWAVSRGR